MRRLIAAATLGLAACAGPVGEPEPADLVLRNGSIYTVDAKRSVTQALAIRNGSIVFVGADAEASRYVGASTRVRDLEGHFVLPGLHDAHIHAMGIVQPDVCDLENQPRSLDEIVSLLRDCQAHYRAPEGEWIAGHQWNFSVGNQPSARHATLRAALDAVSTTHPVVLIGSDGHHAAVNSAALARACDARGEPIGLSQQTLATAFADYRTLVAVDERGEPSGGLTEGARALVGAPHLVDLFDYDALVPQIAGVLAESGITSIQDAWVAPEMLEPFRHLEDRGGMTFRMRAALYRDFPSSEVALAMLPETVEQFSQVRAQYANSEQIRPDAVKIFVDGVIEGNPLATPPTLPNAAVLRAYAQPIFAVDPGAGGVSLRGYVDVDGAPCQRVRADPAAYADAAAVRAFQAEQRFVPAQCVKSRGVLEHSDAFIHAFVDQMERAGFAVHAHAIGDRAMRVVLDAFEASRRANGAPRRAPSIAHAQLVHPDDQRRLGALGVYVAFTYAWIRPELAYDMSVIPFIDELEGIDELYDPRNYYVQNAYPANSIRRHGGILVAGSDAPVDVRSPRPFVNMQQALTRAGDGVVLNPDERIDIHEIIAAYTLHGAQLLDQASRVGSLEVGKRADLIVLDRNLVALAESGRAEEIGAARVLLTLFDGDVVYESGP